MLMYENLEEPRKTLGFLKKSKKETWNIEGRLWDF
jgi:hypothetical protein